MNKNFVHKQVSINNMTAPDFREENNVLVFPDSEDSDSDNTFFQKSSSWADFSSISKDSTPQKPKRQARPRRNSMIKTCSSHTDVFGSDVLATDPWVDFNNGFDFDYSSDDDDEDCFTTAFPSTEGKSEAKSKGNPDGQEGTMPLRDHNRKVKKGRAKSISRGRQRRSKSHRVRTNEEVGQKRRNRSRSKPSFVAGIRTRSLSVPKNKLEDESQKESAGSSSHSRKSVNLESASTKSKSKPKASKSKKRTGDDHSEGDHAQPQGDRLRKTSRDGSLNTLKTLRDKSPKAKRDRSSKVPKAKGEKASRSKSPKPSRDRLQKVPKASRSKSPKPSRDSSSRSLSDTSSKSPRDRSRKTNDEGKSLKIKGIDEPPKTPPASRSVAKQKDVGWEKEKKPKLYASPLPVKSYLSRGTQKRLYFGVSKLMDYRKFNIKESMSILLSDDDAVDNDEDENSAHSDPTERKRSSSMPRVKEPIKLESEHTPSSTNRRQRRHSILGAPPFERV